MIFVVTVFNSCQEQNLPIIQSIKTKDIKEVRLGESNYYLLLPNNFEISEAQGKEGSLGYDIFPKDTSLTMFGFIDIRHGNPIGSNSEDNSAKVFAISNLSDKKVKWKIYQTETGYFNAFTSESGDLNATASSKNRIEVDSLISIIATLKRK